MQEIEPLDFGRLDRTHTRTLPWQNDRCSAYVGGEAQQRRLHGRAAGREARCKRTGASLHGELAPFPLSDAIQIALAVFQCSPGRRTAYEPVIASLIAEI